MRDSSHNSVAIDGFTIGHDHPVFVIAEAGVAHFGCMRRAKRLVDMAYSSGAHAVKFQIYKTENLINHSCPEWRERLAPKELPYESFAELQSYCKEVGILFLATAHDEESFSFLQTLDVPAYKIGSGEVDNWPFLRTIASNGKPVIVSTGLHSADQIRTVVNIFDECDNHGLILLHCNTAYPTPVEQSHLRTIPWMINEFSVPVGYSDHTVGIDVTLAAVALGACVIEKHICEDKNTEGSQDCRVSCDAQDLPVLVQGVKTIKAACGEVRTQVIAAAKPSIAWARKSIVLNKDVPVNHVLGPDDFRFERPGTGISPAEPDKVIGSRVIREMKQGELLSWEQIECRPSEEKYVS